MGPHRHPGHHGGYGNEPLFIQWTFPGGIPNPEFIEQLKQQAPEAKAPN